jgi:hypothetical protein
MNTQDIINKIAKLKDAIEGESDPEIKARYSSKIASLEADLNKEEEKVEQKIEKQEVAEQKELSEAEKKIAKLKDALSGESDPDIKARYEKKIKELQGDLGEVKQEIKEEKKEIAKQKKEIKQAVKQVRSVKKVVRKEAVKKAVKKVAERKKVVEVAKPKRKTKLKSIMSELDALIRNNKKLAAKYKGKTGLPAGQRVDLKRDAKRSAKPFGWRFTGKYDYRDPKKVLTERQFKNAKKKGLLDYESRPNRSDVYPAGFKGKKTLVKGKKVAGGVKRALADGGMMDDGGMMKKGGVTRDAARFAKPKGWRWKNEAVGNVELTPGHPLKKSALSKEPSKKARRNNPDYVAFENRGSKSDKKPYRRYKSL